MKVDDSYSNYMYDFIDTICKKFGPRYSCSKAEMDANLWIKEELDKFCDSTFIDEFETTPAMYPQGFIKVAGFLGGISPIFIPLLFPLPIISLILVIMGLVIIYAELFLMKEWIKFLFKKKRSSNVFGIIKPKGEVKFRIIFEGHTDSAKEMLIASYKPRTRQLIAVIGVYFLIHTIIFSICKFIAQILPGNPIIMLNWTIFSWTIIDTIYFISLIIIYPFFILLLRGFLGKQVVLGANDNLSGSAVSSAIGKILSENRPQHVEIWIGSQGSEEVGDKGAKAFVEKYGKLGILDNSYTVVLECCGAADRMLLLEKDMHTKTYPKELIEKLQISYENAKNEIPNILKLDIGSLKIGSCDACRYVHKGYKAIPLFGAESKKNKAVNWHSVKDSPENISKRVLKDFLTVCFNFVEVIDKSFT
ncbi:MAG: M28 family peptidase [Promethearchaeota archaeon]